MTDPVAPSAVYSIRSEPVGLRIATGGSGQSGLLEALAKAFVQYCVDSKGVQPFLVEWYKSDTTFSIENLRKKVADVGITYHAVAEQTALDDGVIDRVGYAWRDHWMLVGPTDNPAELPENDQSTIYSLVTRLFSAMEETKDSPRPIKFLSRYDKSAGNIVESLLWASIGQVPWADPRTAWYHMFPNFPFQAIREAAGKGEYTITDKGTYWAIEDETRDKLTVFAEGKDDENDPLLNPAHVLVGKYAKNKQRANEFVDWIGLEHGGQQVIKDFQKNGKVLYSTIPVGVDPLGRVKGILGFASSVKAAVPVPSHDDIYFFNNKQYTRVNPYTDTTYTNVTDIWGMWPGLYQVGFAPVNAAFTTPENPNEAYFFCESRCAKVNLITGQLAPGSVVFDFHEAWSGLKDAGFDTVDATLSFAFMGSSYENVICFFRKGKYALIDVHQNKTLEWGEISSRFKALGKAKFRNIDAVVFKPGKQKRQAYYFSGTQYVLVDLPGDYIAWGPLDVGSSWKSLRAAGFY